MYVLSKKSDEWQKDSRHLEACNDRYGEAKSTYTYEVVLYPSGSPLRK